MAEAEGPLDFPPTGMPVSLVDPLARAGISILALSAFDTDDLMVKGDRLEDALRVLKDSGHQRSG